MWYQNSPGPLSLCSSSSCRSQLNKLRQSQKWAKLHLCNILLPNMTNVSIHQPTIRIITKFRMNEKDHVNAASIEFVLQISDWQGWARTWTLRKKNCKWVRFLFLLAPKVVLDYLRPMISIPSNPIQSHPIQSILERPAPTPWNDFPPWSKFDGCAYLSWVTWNKVRAYLNLFAACQPSHLSVPMDNFIKKASVLLWNLDLEIISSILVSSVLHSENSNIHDDTRW